MTFDWRSPRFFALAAVTAAMLLSAVSESFAAGGEVPPATVATPLRDPWVPPEARKPSVEPPSEGAALRAQIERKLKAAFDSADVAGTGTITREQARRAGLGFVVRHFEAIDTTRSGGVRFDDVKRFLRANGARLD